MAILEKCKKCQREGGYATSADANVCARCERDKGSKKPKNGDEDDDDDE